MRRDQRDDLRYAGETILGRADWGDRESDYEHGFRGRENSPEMRYPAPQRYSGQAQSHWQPGKRDEYRYAGETALGRADWGDRESDYEHGFRALREGRGLASESREHWRVPGEHTGRGPRGYRRTDERIWEDVCDRLTDDAHVDATDVEVRVEDGEVTLNGTVRSRPEKHHAEDIIESVPGVRDVHNHLHVHHDVVGTPGTVPTPLDLSSPGGPSRRQVEKAGMRQKRSKRGLR
jgi:osmotically-inducible protein OsmY